MPLLVLGARTLHGYPSRILVDRLRAAVSLIDAAPDPVQVVVSGDGEAAAMARRQRGNVGVVKRNLARGPGNLGQALGIDLGDYGRDLFDPGSRVQLGDGAAPAEVQCGPRVGLRAASERPWRFWIPGEPGVSAYRRHAKADGLG